MVNDFFDRIQSNPMVLAGLSIAQGNDVSKSLTDAARVSREYEQNKIAQSQAEQQLMLQQKLPYLLNSVDPTDPQGSVNTLVSNGVPIDAALRIVGDVSKLNANQRKQEALSAFSGGGGGFDDPAALVKAGLVSGDSSLIQAGSALSTIQQNQRSNIEGKPPAGFRRTQEGNLEPIPGAPQGKSSPEVAAKSNLIRQADKLVNNVNNKLFDDSGNVDNNLLAGMITNAPRTEGRRLRSQLNQAIRAKLRVESGAVISQEEADEELKTFLPSFLDNDATKRDKLVRLQEFFRGTSQSIDPNLSLPGDKTQGLTEAEKAAQLPEENIQDGGVILPPGFQNDPRVLKARQVGYSDAEIMDFIGGGR